MCVYIYIYIYVLSHSVVSDSVSPWTVAQQAPLSMGILQARILEWVAMPSSYTYIYTHIYTHVHIYTHQSYGHFNNQFAYGQAPSEN